MTALNFDSNLGYPDNFYELESPVSRCHQVPDRAASNFSPDSEPFRACGRVFLATSLRSVMEAPRLANRRVGRPTEGVRRNCSIKTTLKHEKYQN